MGENMDKIKFQFKEIVSKYRILISIILGIFVALGIQLKFFCDANTMGFVTKINDAMYLLFCIGICVLLYYSSKIKNIRLWRVSIVVGIIFAICYFLGDLQNDFIIFNNKIIGIFYFIYRCSMYII